MSKVAKGIANRDVREHVYYVQPFVTKNKTIFATNNWCNIRGGMYVVYSYGEHWPMLVYFNYKWYTNADPPYSRTTARHMSLVGARNISYVRRSRDELLQMIDEFRSRAICGYVADASDEEDL